jgi:hypothetical protein
MFSSAQTHPDTPKRQLLAPTINECVPRWTGGSLTGSKLMGPADGELLVVWRRVPICGACSNYCTMYYEYLGLHVP